MALVTPQLVRGAWRWTSGMVIDADGARNAYRLDGQGLDYLANARCKDGSWCGVVTGADGKPIQLPDGSLVSPTSLVDHSIADLANPARYVDAAQIPYLAIPPELRALGVRFGDVAVVLYRGVHVGAICADGCPHSHYGEASIACARALGIPSSPKSGGVSAGVTFLVFPGSARASAWPRRVDSISAQASVLFDAWGGAVAV